MGRFLRAADISVASDFHFQEETIDFRAFRAYYGKQGHICCCCCCDTRRASIIMNIFYIIFCFMGAAITYLVAEELVPFDDWFDMVHAELELLDDDYLHSDLDTAFGEYSWALYTYLGVCVFFALLGIEGAVNYRPCMVIICSMWYLLQGIASLFLFGLGGLGIFVASLWAYPNIMLYQEQTEGIMSEKNYENEMHSCCCIKDQHRRVTVGEAIENRIGVFS